MPNTHNVWNQEPVAYREEAHRNHSQIIMETNYMTTIQLSS